MEKENNEENLELQKRKDKIKNWLKNPHNLIFLAIIIFAISIRFHYFLLTENQPLWWDEAEYMSTAKGFAGIIENEYQIALNRFPGFPLLVSLFYMVGIRDEVVLRFLLAFLPSLIAIVLMYSILVAMYSDKRIALISTAIFSVLWEHIFYSNRFHTENFSLIFEFLAIFVLFAVYLKNQDFYFIRRKHAFIWIALSSVLCILFRSANMVFIPVVILFLIVINLYKVPKKFKRISWIAFIISIILAFISIAFLSYRSEFVHQFYRHDLPFPWITFSVFYGFYQSLIPSIPSVLFYIFLLGIASVIGQVVIFPEGLKKIDKDVEDNSYKADIFNLVLIAGFLFFFIFMLRPPAFEYRWFFAFLPAMLAFTAKGLVSVGDYVRSASKVKSLSIILTILFLSLGLYTQWWHADMIIKNKLTSYQEVKDSGLWIKENSNENDIILTSSPMQHAYYGERRVYNVDSFKSEEEFADFVNTSNPRYLILSIFQPSQNWMYEWPHKHNETVRPVQVYFVDTEKEQPILIIYEVTMADYPLQ